MYGVGDFEGLFAEFVENSEDVVLLVDREFKIRYASPSVQEKFNKDSIVVLGKDVFDFVKIDKRDDWKNCLLTGKDSFSEDIRIEMQGQTYYFEVNVLNLRNGIGRIFKLHDITNRKAEEKKLKHKNKQLDQVLYKTIHDLKAPVSSALGLVSLSEMTDNRNEQIEYLNLLRSSLTKMDTFIDEMGDFFRNEKFSIQNTKVNLTSVIQNELENLKNLYHVRKIFVDVDIDEGTELYSDSVRIKSVVTNILSNAIKYSDSRKPVSTIKITGFVDEEICGLKIEDNGIGIEPENQERIYEMFFRGTSQAQGSGLGLYLVKETIERMNGSIEMRSKLGTGTIFEVQIPNQILLPNEAAKEIRTGSQSF